MGPCELLSIHLPPRHRRLIQVVDGQWLIAKLPVPPSGRQSAAGNLHAFNL
jgi:hypothetical protein